MEEYVTRQEHEEFSRRQDEENQRQNERLKILEETVKEIKDLTISVKGLAENMKSMLQEQEMQGQRLSKLENKSVEKWQKVLSTIGKAIITTLVGGLVGYMLCKVGIS